MVDIGVVRQARHSAVNGRDESGLVVELRPADELALADYEAFCRTAIHGPAQHPLWISNWVTATGADAVIVMLRRAGAPVVAFALEIVREGPFRIARFPGGHHANGNFVALAHNCDGLGEDDARTICSALHEARPDIDLVCLERQNPHQDGVANPLSGLASIRSPNLSLAVDLSGGFAGVKARRHGKRKLKKYRLQVRKFEEAGGYRLITATTPEETDRLLDAFFAMKASRFSERGISNVFAAKDVQAFFRNLFRDALERPERPYELHAVEVAGQLVAVNGCSITSHSLVCEFGGIVDRGDNSSPGYFLDFFCIEEACHAGKALYDFSVGDEVYKRSWCDVETWQFDTLLPLTAKGRALWAVEVGRAHAVRLVKSNDALWSFVKQMRTRIAGGKPPAPAED